MAAHYDNPIRVIVKDTETGEEQEAEVRDNYVLVTTGRRYLAHQQHYANGTSVLTIKHDWEMDGDDEATK